MQYSGEINQNVGDDDDDAFYAKEYHCVTTPWRRLCLALGHCWQEHTSCLGTQPQDLYHKYYPHQSHDDYEDSTRIALLSEHEGRIRKSRLPSNFTTRTTQSTMDKEGIFFIASLPLQNHQSKRSSLTRKTCTDWKIQRRMLSIPVMATRFQRPAMALDDDEEDFHSVKSRNVGGKPSRSNMDYGHEFLWVENYWPQDVSSSRQGVQPRSVSAFDKVLTFGSSTAVECLMIPPEPSICSHQDNSCTSSLSSKEEVSRYDATDQSLSVNKATIPGVSSRADPALDEEDDSFSRDATAKLYPQSLTRGWQAKSSVKRLSSTVHDDAKHSNTRGCQAQDDRDDEESTSGSCYSIPTLTVSFEDDVAQLAVAFSTSFKDNDDSDGEEDEEEVITQTMGLHCFTLGANFSHPAAAWNKTKQLSSLAPPPPISRSSSIDSSSSKSTLDSAQSPERRARKIGISFPHPWYSSKLLHLPKRDSERYQHFQQQQRQPPTSPQKFVEERDDQDVWSMVESDPMDGDMTDPPTPIPIKTSKVWSPDHLGWSSSEEDDDADEMLRLEKSSQPASWGWPKTSVHPVVGKSSRSSAFRRWEELPEDNDGFIVRKPPQQDKLIINRRVEEKEMLVNRDLRSSCAVERAPVSFVYSPRLTYPPFKPLFLNS